MTDADALIESVDELEHALARYIAAEVALADRLKAADARQDSRQATAEVAEAAADAMGMWVVSGRPRRRHGGRSPHRPRGINDRSLPKADREALRRARHGVVLLERRITHVVGCRTLRVRRLGEPQRYVVVAEGPDGQNFALAEVAWRLLPLTTGALNPTAIAWTVDPQWLIDNRPAAEARS